ncbi:ribbon-helix-helix domain-containing protein [Salinimonas chungwhensis]|uniref:ribbon-helix-helix domain-containing protein n=1 Tax=Salinimonas chungwhensis TaxID=265425 RepID=UPI00036360DD|nr:ribbon-helix-helix domain-containing protein [Salinimonas chungwhensis]
MSLCNLKKSTPSAKARSLSVEAFIEEANHYAQGHRPLTEERVSTIREPSVCPIRSETSTMRRATFTLSESTIAKLSVLSTKTGISRSRLIRIWVERAHQYNDLIDLTYDTTP